MPAIWPRSWPACTPPRPRSPPTRPPGPRARSAGPQTRLGLAHAAAERNVARAEFIAGVSRGAPGLVPEDDPAPDGAARARAARPTPGAHVSRVAPAPDDTGDLRQISPTRLIHRLASARANGLLVLEGRAGILKEIYLGAGHPQYVSSNVVSERLGDFLIAQGVVSATALERAVAVMPRFGGRLADTLVGLGLVSALDAYRLLTAQVTGKLIDVCSWTKGRHRWYLGRANPFQVQPLHLDAFRVLATAATSLAAGFVDEWLATRLDRRPGPGEPGDLGDFGLGEALTRVHGMLDGRASIGELPARIRSDEARLNFSRLLYLLIESERVTIRDGAPS